MRNYKPQKGYRVLLHLNSDNLVASIIFYLNTTKSISIDDQHWSDSIFQSVDNFQVRSLQNIKSKKLTGVVKIRLHFLQYKKTLS